MNRNWTVMEILKTTERYLREKSIPNSRLDSELMLCKVLDCERIDLYTGFDRPLTQRELDCYRTYVSRRARREPLSYITGGKEFFSLEFNVDSSALIPRPESELLVEEVISRAAGMERKGRFRVLDVGTGSGCIAVTLARYLPEAQVTAVEKERSTCRTAEKNAEKHRVAIRFICADFFETDLTGEGLFDVIVSNPPYVSESDYTKLAPEIVEYEPRTALVAGVSGTELIVALLRKSTELLKPGGVVFIEIGDGQQQVTGDAAGELFEQVRFVRDLSGKDRVLVAEGKK